MNLTRKEREMEDRIYHKNAAVSASYASEDNLAPDRVRALRSRVERVNESANRVRHLLGVSADTAVRVFGAMPIPAHSIGVAEQELEGDMLLLDAAIALLDNELDRLTPFVYKLNDL